MPGPADREETLRRCREIQVRLETLTAEARAGLDRLLKESGDLDFISEIIARLKDVGNSPKAVVQPLRPARRRFDAGRRGSAMAERSIGGTWPKEGEEPRVMPGYP